MTDFATSRNFRIGVSALIFQQDTVLLALRRDIDWWNLPGGGMEVGETVEEAVCREVLEETGLVVVVEKLVGVYSKPQKQEVVLSFLCQVTGGTLVETEESRACAYFVPDAIPVNTLPKHRERIQDALLHQERAILHSQINPSEVDQNLTRQ